MARMAELRTAGWSASAIAADLGGGVTRNAVIGKLGRMKVAWKGEALKYRPPLKKRPVAAKRPPRKVSPAPQRPLPPPPAPTPLGGGPITIADLTNYRCHWPLGDPKEASFRYCGAAKAPDGPYCASHKALARSDRHDPHRSA